MSNAQSISARACVLTVAVLLAAGPMSAWAGGTPEHAVLIVDPMRPDSMYLANYYRAARDVPDLNVIYTSPTASSFASFSSNNVNALLGYLANAGIRDHIDFVIIAPTDQYRMVASGLISDSCSSVTRFSLTGAYTFAFVTGDVLGGLTSLAPNEYFRGNNGPRAFSSNEKWLSGLPSGDANAKQYFLAAQLGYTGTRGNSVSELITMIDRSVAADGTSPSGTTPIGTFYYMETTDTARSGPRDPDYPARVTDLLGLGANAQHLMAVLPTGQHDCLGIMTGWASPGIVAADMTILPGAFCDHLTSYAGHFDTSSQEKMSQWIIKGASGSWGTVEEPCNYPNKFPNPRLHVLYYKGLTLGEACFRSIAAMPFQGMLYGDPLTRPFTHIPAVSVPDAPTGPVSGTITLTPSATTTDTGAAIARYDLMIDGVVVDSVGLGGQFSVDTTEMSDGWHDLRVLATDNRVQEATGRWVGALDTSNHGYAISITPATTTGNLTSQLSFDVIASGANIHEIRLIHNGRVIDTAVSSPATLRAYGLTLGAGPARVQAEVVLPMGRTVRTAPVDLDITYNSGTPTGAPPVAHSFRKYIRTDSAAFVELPYDYDDETDVLTFNVLSSPAQATLGGGTSAYRIVYPDPNAVGVDTFTYEVVGTSGTSAPATVTLVYDNAPCEGDVDGDGAVNLTDLGLLLGDYGCTGAGCIADVSGDGVVDLTDLGMVLGNYQTVCP